MSRIGRQKINIPENVTVTITDGIVFVKSNNNEFKYILPAGISAEVSDNSVMVKRSDDSKPSRSLHGTSNRVIANMVVGSSVGFMKKLSFKGVGYTIVPQDGKISMRLGYSHPVIIDIPENIFLKVERNIIIIEGNNKNSVGDFAAKIRETRKPEVYKGKGIKYIDEVIRKKAGKTAQSS